MELWYYIANMKTNVGNNQSRRKKETNEENSNTRNSNRCKVCIWILIAVVCITVCWFIVLLPIPLSVASNSFPKPNISQNEMLLNTLNLSNLTVYCPDSYTFSPSEQKCTTICGYHDHYPEALTIIKRVLLSLIAVFNSGISILAVIHIVKYYKQYKFQHHPIFVGVFINLVQSFVIGIPDLLGANLFFCEGRRIDYATLNENPPVQLHIQGFLVTILSISNRLWFVMAIVLIFPSTFAFSNVLVPVRNRIIIVMIELVICVAYPLVCGLASFIPFRGYRLSESVLLPVSANPTVRTVFGAIPQLVISGVTITVIILLLYRLHSQIQSGSKKTDRKIGLLPIEKRLIILSSIYLLLIAIIAVTFAFTKAFRGLIDNRYNEYSSYITLMSNYSLPNSTQQNTTLSLLPHNEQLLFHKSHPFYLININDLSIRGMFILVSCVFYLSYPKVKICQKEKKRDDTTANSQTAASCSHIH